MSWIDDDGRFRGVPDGKGGLEPRYTCNIIFYNKDEAYNVLKDISCNNCTANSGSIWDKYNKRWTS
jgi:hypothetical protein